MNQSPPVQAWLDSMSCLSPWSLVTEFLPMELGVHSPLVKPGKPTYDSLQYLISHLSTGHRV